MPCAHVLGSLGVVGRQRRHRLRPVALPGGHRSWNCSAGIAKHVGVTADLVERGEPRGAVERVVLDALGHHHPAGLLEAQRCGSLRVGQHPAEVVERRGPGRVAPAVRLRVPGRGGRDRRAGRSGRPGSTPAPRPPRPRAARGGAAAGRGARGRCAGSRPAGCRRRRRACGRGPARASPGRRPRNRVVEGGQRLLARRVGRARGRAARARRTPWCRPSPTPRGSSSPVSRIFSMSV